MLKQFTNKRNHQKCSYFIEDSQTLSKCTQNWKLQYLYWNRSFSRFLHSFTEHLSQKLGSFGSFGKNKKQLSLVFYPLLDLPWSVMFTKSKIEKHSSKRLPLTFLAIIRFNKKSEKNLWKIPVRESSQVKFFQMYFSRLFVFIGNIKDI